MKNTKTFSFSNLTRLPVSTFSSPDKLGGAVKVSTPHRGEVLIDTKKISSAMFGADRNVETETSKIAKQLLALEEESKEFLLTQWLTPPHNE